MRVVTLKCLFEMTPLYRVVLLKIKFERAVCRFKDFLELYMFVKILAGRLFVLSELLLKVKVAEDQSKNLFLLFIP